jgi:predicted peroxiredoxin
MIEGADKYVTKQGSTWMIFTEDKRWVVEFTKDKTLWFNYNLFQSELDLVSKDCTEEKDLIKNWFESRFLNKPKVDETLDNAANMIHNIEDTIENGVKDTIDEKSTLRYIVEDTIQNGVKQTKSMLAQNGIRIKETIENGVKETIGTLRRTKLGVDDIIKNGVKETKEDRLFRTIHVMNAIVNGVKHVEDGDWLDQDERIDDIIENGVKETKEVSNISLMSEMFKVKAKQSIRDGVKEIQPLPAQDGNRDWGLYYHRQEDRTKPHTEYVKEVIEDSYNHMGRVEGVIRNTDKDGI